MRGQGFAPHEAGKDLMKLIERNKADPGRRNFVAADVSRECSHEIIMQQRLLLMSGTEFRPVFGMEKRAKDPALPRLTLRGDGGDRDQEFYVFKAESLDDLKWHRCLLMNSKIATCKVEHLMEAGGHMHAAQADKMYDLHSDALRDSTQVSSLLGSQAYSGFSSIAEYKVPLGLRIASYMNTQQRESVLVCLFYSWV